MKRRYGEVAGEGVGGEEVSVAGATDSDDAAIPAAALEAAEGYTAYVPLRERRAAEAARRAAKRARVEGAATAPASALAATAAAIAGGGAGGGGLDDRFTAGSLLHATRQAHVAGLVSGDGEAAEAARARREEADLLAQVAAVQKHSLVSAKEHAHGIRYTEPLHTDWRPPRSIRNRSEEENNAMRAKYHILVKGEAPAPPIKSFAEMRFPQPILDALAAKGIKSPTPIQVQGLPVALSGRDLIGIAFTGSGKTLVFTLPAVMFALQEEVRMPLVQGEGPISVIMAPSRELARQTYDNAVHFATYLKNAGFPALRIMLAIGGEDTRTQMESARGGVHIIVATPGRLKDHLAKKRVNLDLCRYVSLDEGDQMLDTGFDAEVEEIFSYFKRQRQIVIFSATMAPKIEAFARSSLVKPVVVNVGRAGAASLNIVQDVEYVKPEARVVTVLSSLQKTPPPVLIFAENKRDVEDVNEYLLLKGVSSVCVHGSMSQDDRNDAIAQFKAGTKDILVATDVAAKGLDFPAIQHVINFDLPKAIEQYVHRIGRTGRAGRTGVATTYINNTIEETTLLDLKHLLIEAKQHVPPVLLALDDPRDHEAAAGGAGEDGGGGCAYCGGLGHRISECPKLEHQRRQLAGPRKDYLSGGGGGW